MSLPTVVPRLSSLSGSSDSSSSGPFDPSANANRTQAVWENWASTSRCTPAYFHTPRCVEEIQSVLRYAAARREPVRVVGYGHSPGHIALTDGHMLALGAHFDRIVAIDRRRMRVTAEAGISLEALNAALDIEGLALPSLGSISDQTLGGALACGTHGTNARASSIIAAFVTELELLDASGEIWTCSAEQNTDLFNAARISLGALGVLTRITLQCEIAYDLVETTVTIPFREWVNPARFEEMLQHPDADFVRFHWIPHTESVIYTRMKKAYNAAGNRDSVLRAQSAASSPLLARLQKLRDAKDRFVGFHMLQALYFASTFGQLDRVLVPRIAQLYSKLICPPLPRSGTSTRTASSQWVRQDRHDRILNFDCLFKQYVTEWAIDQQHTVAALIAVREYIQQQRFVVHFPIEVRFGGGTGSAAGTAGTTGAQEQDGDGIWLSPCYASKQTWIGIIMYRGIL